jgi:hypothetical protein
VGKPEYCGDECKDESMTDLTNPTWIKLKGLLFLAIGIVTALLMLLEHPTIKTALLLAVCVWAFCRFYYFAFYVIERYVDRQYRFAGLWSFVRYLFGNKKSTPNITAHNEE